MTSYYKRYLDGEHETVCKELVQLGPDIRTGRHLSDANDVAKVIAERGYFNLSLFYRRLLDIDYHFDEPESALLESSPNDIRQLNDAEQRFGVLPVTVRAWCERIASANFCQAQSQLFSEADKGSGDEVSVAGLGLNPVLVFLSLPRCVTMHLRLIEDEEDKEDGTSAWLKTLFPTGGWASNCNPKGFHLPETGFDGVLYNEGFGDVHFIQELRTAFSWGGFPFWRKLLNRKRVASPLRCSPDFAKLFPNLSDGLLTL